MDVKDIDKLSKDLLKNSVPRDHKNVISNILASDQRTWFSSEEQLPNEGEPVMIRLVDTNKVVDENLHAIIYLEDMKVATYHPGSKTWTIEPPFPRYDYSPLSSKEKVNPEAEISHWSKLKEGELESWKYRLKPLHLYNYLRLEVDKEHDEDVYIALIHAADCIMKVYGEAILSEHDTEFDEYYKTICDLQAAMDGEVSYSLENEIFYSLGELSAMINKVSLKVSDMKSRNEEVDTITKNLINMMHNHVLQMLIEIGKLVDPGHKTLISLDANAAIQPSDDGIPFPAVLGEEVIDNAMDN